MKVTDNCADASNAPVHIPRNNSLKPEGVALARNAEHALTGNGSLAGRRPLL